MQYKYIDEYIFPERRRNRNFKNLKLRNSLFSLKGYNPIIPNELKRYFKDKLIDNSYLKKLSILLHNNEKNYDKKRLDINNLTNAFDSNNREYLTKLKFNFNSENSNSTENDRTIEYKSINSEKLLSYSINYIREPKVIKNNEKLMIDFFKKKNKIDKLPYLSLSTNDLINFNYKRHKDKSDILKNWMSSDNNYLNIMPKNQKLHFKKIKISSRRNINDKKDLKSSLSVKSIDDRKISNKLFLDNTSKNKLINQVKNIKYISNSNSILPKNDLKNEDDERLEEQYNILKKLSNKEVIKKIEDSIEIKGIEKKFIPNYLNGKYESKIDLQFGNHFPYIKRNLYKK